MEFLRLYHPLRDYVSCGLNEDGTLDLTVTGPLFSAMQFEIYLLEIVNEVYFRFTYDYDKLVESARRRLNEKVADFKAGKYNFRFSSLAVVEDCPVSGRTRWFVLSKKRQM